MNIKIENFEGPFDLLLHLIKKNKMDIYNVNIYRITISYIEYINALKEMNLDIASEFIVMATTLLELKSKALLPKLKNEDEENEEDNSKILFERLIDYKKFKKVTEYLMSRYVSSGNVYFKKPDIILQKKDYTVDLNDILKGFTILDFYTKYKSLIDSYLEKQNTSNPIQTNIYLDKFKIQDKIKTLKQFKDSVFRFNDFVKSCSHKAEVIVTFIALLELIKQKYFRVIQENKFKDIIVEKI